MSAGLLNITVEKGATFSKTISLKDAAGAAINLTGATVAAKMRPYYSAEESFAFTMAITSPATAGIITWQMAAATTATIPTDETQEWVYDVEVTYSGGTISRILQGAAFVSPEATRT